MFDLFHIGHLNVLKTAKESCDFLIVGVTVDSLVGYKGKKAIIPYEERAEIVKSIKYVDMVVPQETMDKMAAWTKFHFNKIFLGSDWKGSETWDKWEEEFHPLGVEIVYVDSIGPTSTELRDVIHKFNNEE